MTVATSTSKSGPYAGAGTTGPFTVGFRFLATDHLQVVQADEDGVETVLVLDTDYTVAGVGAGTGSVTLAVALPVGETLTITRSVPFTQEADYVANDAFPAESHERALDLLTMQTQELNEKVARSAKLPVSSTADADSLVADIVLLADNLTTIGTVAGSINDVQAVAAIDDDVAVVAANVADITNFADVYLGPAAADPTLRADGTPLQIGDLYFNTGTSLIRVYSSLGWVDAQTPVPITITRQQFSGTGAQTAFTLSSAPAFLNALFVEISGVSQVPSVDYTLSGTTLTFTSAPPLGADNILARWFSPISAGVPNDGSVTLTKLDGGFVLPVAQGGTGVDTVPEIQALLPINQARVDLASASTVNLTTGAASTDHVNITGTTTITGFTVAAGRVVFVRFAGVLILTNGANIGIQSGANITTAAGDTCVLRAISANVVEVLFFTRGISQAVGDGQTWQDVTGSRALSTGYTNTTGRPIMVAISTTSAASSSMALTIAGVQRVNSNANAAGSSMICNVVGIVPPGQVYFVVGTAIGSWHELR